MGMEILKWDIIKNKNKRWIIIMWIKKYHGQEEYSLVGSFKEGQDPQRAAEPVMMMMKRDQKTLKLWDAKRSK